MDLLWLDDKRNPYDHVTNSFDKEITWVKSYEEFVDHIRIHGVPDKVSLDHDLAPEGKTGLDCVKFLIQYCEERSMSLPEWAVHSQNQTGKKNMERLLER